MGGRGSSSGKAGGRGSSSGKAGSGGKGKSNIPVITYATHSQKDQMTMEITNQFFNNYKKYGEGGQQANEMVIDGFLKEGIIDVDTLIIDAKSGTSGAGRGAKTPNLFCEVNENMKAYGVANHRHTPEIEEQLGYACDKEVVLNFTPHLVPMNRGILATEYAKLNKKADGTLPTYDEIKAVYDKYYADEKFVRVLNKGALPETKWVEGSNYVDINFVIDERTGRIIMMGALDNIVKGAAGQAVQNMNILFGFDESEGLNLIPMFP